MQKLLSQLIPFILFGIAIVALLFGIMIFAYLFFFGAAMGLLLFIISWIRNRFFRPKTVAKPKHKPGRIIDSDDWKKL